MESLNLLYRHGNRVPARKKPAPKGGVMDYIFRQIKTHEVVTGKTVYIECDDGDLKKMKIDEVLRPGDLWKAFCADDGCRYGHDGCFVKVKDGE